MIARETRGACVVAPVVANETARLRILSLSCVYPNPDDPHLGSFVRSRIKHVGKLAEVKVLAPIAQLDFARGGRARSGRGIPSRLWDEEIEVFHPSWIYPPGGNAINPAFLFLRLLPLAARIRKDFEFDLIDSHFAFPDGIAAALLARRLGVRFSVTLRGSELLHAQYPRRRKFMGWALRRASAVIALSEELKVFAVSLGADAARVKVIPNGIDPAIFYPRDRDRCRAKHGINRERKIVLSAGSLIELKGHHRTVKAVAAIRAKGLDVEFLIAGGAGRAVQYEPEIRKQVADSELQDRVRLLGEIPPDDLAELMCAADVFCLASSREGWPNVVHEALACGTPVVATRVGAVAEMIPSSDYGFVVPPGEVEALSKALREALEKEWDGAVISRLAQARTWTQTASEAIDFLRQRAAVGK
jgi:glycosyltransferase involved in cell wall biosynthesis